MTLQDTKLTIGGREVLVTNVEINYEHFDGNMTVSVEGRLLDKEETKQPEPAYCGVDLAEEGSDATVYTHYFPTGMHRKQAEIFLTATPEGNEYFKKFYENAWHYGANDEDEELTKKEEEVMCRDRDCGSDCRSEKAAVDGGYYGGEELAQEIKNLDLTSEQRKLLKYGLVNHVGLITNKGKEVLLNHLLTVYSEDIVADLEALEESKKPQAEEQE